MTTFWTDQNPKHFPNKYLSVAQKMISVFDAVENIARIGEMLRFWVRDFIPKQLVEKLHEYDCSINPFPNKPWFLLV